MRSKSLFELASVPPVHSESLFEPAVQDHYSKVLVSVALCSESLYSALLCYVYGYARVHTSISAGPPGATRLRGVSEGMQSECHLHSLNVYIYAYIDGMRVCS